MSNKYSTSKYERGQLMDKKDYYKILGLKEDANQIEIYNAYFNLAKIHHPDKGGTNEKMAKINLAFKELFDRKKYNELRLKKGISSYSTNNQDDVELDSCSDENVSSFIKCPSCGALCEETANFCDMCGFSFKDSDSSSDSESVECPSCGALCEDSGNFCNNCGANLNNNNSIQNKNYENLFDNIFKVPLYNTREYRFSLSKLFGFSMLLLFIIMALYYLFSNFDSFIILSILSFLTYSIFRIIGFVIRKFKCWYYENYSNRNNFNQIDSSLNKIFKNILYVKIKDNSEYRLSKSKFIGLMIVFIIWSFVILLIFFSINFEEELITFIIVVFGLFCYAICRGFGFIIRQFV